MDLFILNDAAAAAFLQRKTRLWHLRQMLLHCCGSERLVTKMTTKFPVHDSDELCQATDAVNASLLREDWLKAFAVHPRVCLIKRCNK